MGLGKTLQTIGLILSSKPNGVNSYPIKNDMPDVENNPRCTLIVAPGKHNETLMLFRKNAFIHVNPVD